MKIKKYIAPTMKEAIEQMRGDLGDDAIILSSRTLPRSHSSQEAVELTAALDNPVEEAPKKRPLIQHNNPLQNAYTIQKYAEAFAREATASGKPSRPAPVAAAPEEKAPNGESTRQLQQAAAFIQLQEEISSIKSTLHNVASEVRYKHSASLNDVCRTLYEALMDAGLGEQLALKTISAIMADGAGNDPSGALFAARKFLAGSLPIGQPIRRTGKRQVMAFIGPTGVGKTTTIAKLATALHVVQQTDVLLISADTYRVGGTEQLETIAAIAGIPFQVVYSSQELRQVLLKEVKREYIFVDTVGRNPKNIGQLQEIHAYLQAATPERVFLVQSATSSEPMFRQVMDNLAFLQPTDLIITKLDEMPVAGPLVSALTPTTLPLTYFTTGQAIPDDIEPASRRKLAELLLPSTLESGDISWS